MQPPSRTARALRWAVLTVRCSRPTSSGWDAPSLMTRVTSASQASSRGLAADRAEPVEHGGAALGRPSSVSRGTTTVTCGRTPPNLVPFPDQLDDRSAQASVAKVVQVDAGFGLDRRPQLAHLPHPIRTAERLYEGYRQQEASTSYERNCG